MSNSEVIAVQDQGGEILPVLANDDFLALAEKRVESVQRIKQIALKITNKNDWVDQEGKPYLQASGAEKVARLFGINWSKQSHRKEFSSDDRGPFFFYVYTADFFLRGGDSVSAVGTCSSRDKFFAKERGEWKPASEVDETNIMKAAYTNMVANGITRLLGLRNMNWEEVEKFSGIKRSEVAGVKYDKIATPASSGSVVKKSVIALVTDVEFKAGKKEAVNDKGEKVFKEYTLYFVIASGAKYLTFDSRLAKTAQDLVDAKKIACITFSVDKFGNRLEGIVEATGMSAGAAAPQVDL